MKLSYDLTRKKLIQATEKLQTEAVRSVLS